MTPLARCLGCACALLIAVGACAGPNGTLSGAYRGASDARVEQVPVHGAQVTVVFGDGKTLEGELLAADASAIWVLARQDVIRVSTGAVKIVRAGPNMAAATTFGAWTCGGVLSTISHGFLMIISIPVWLVVGGGTTVATALVNEFELAPGETEALRVHARYPRGMPERKPPAQPAAAVAPSVETTGPAVEVNVDAGPAAEAPPDAGRALDAGAEVAGDQPQPDGGIP